MKKARTPPTARMDTQDRPSAASVGRTDHGLGISPNSYSGAASFLTLQRAAHEGAHASLLNGVRKAVETGTKLVTSHSPQQPEQTTISAPIQRVRTLRAHEKKEIENFHSILEEIYDALVHSRVFTGALPYGFDKLYFDLKTEVEELLEDIDGDDFDDGFSLDAITAKMQRLDTMTRHPKAKLREFWEDRPPADPNKIGADNPKVKSKTQAQGELTALSKENSFEENLALLKQENRVFYVFGKSAMGAGDTAFIVRTVAMLKRYGLNAVAVKQDAEAFDSAQSYGVAHEMTPADMFKVITAHDVIVEGPLTDRQMRVQGKPDYETVAENMINTHNRKIGQSSRDSAEDAPLKIVERPFNLRLYEYGGLSLKAGELRQDPQNVASKAGGVRHGFLGMGHGEMGAFYNATQDKPDQKLPELIQHYAVPGGDTAPLPVAVKLLEIYTAHQGAKFLLGYTNKNEQITKWVQSVTRAVATLGGHYIIIGVFGEKSVPASFHVKESSFTGLYISERENLGVKATTPKETPGQGTNSSVLVTNLLPRPLMVALQEIAEPFMATTGNYSLSEAIEGGKFPSYEALHFNAGVANDLEWQIAHAAEYIDTTPDVRAAMIELAGVSPSGLKDKEDAIRVIVQNPDEVRKLTEFIQSRTEVGKNLITKLAAVVRAGDLGRVILDPEEDARAPQVRDRPTGRRPGSYQIRSGTRSTPPSFGSKSSFSGYQGNRDGRQYGKAKSPVRKSDTRNWHKREDGDKSGKKGW